MATALPSLDRVAGLTRMAGKAALPVGALRALEARRLFRSRGLTDVTLKAALEAWMARVHLLPASVDLRSALVVDVGANEGAFSAGVLGVAPQARILAAEPGPGPRERLRARIGDRPNVEIRDVAVAAESGTATFHLTAHDHNSSLHAPREESRDTIDAGWQVVQELEVRTVSLDELVGDRTADVLKIDVQGSEMDVLAGGERALAHARAVLLEMNFFSQYEGDATFNVLHAEMDRRGFDLVNVSPPLTTADGTPIFVDGCYAPRGR
jgi:FkbM family methyltransferase